MFIKYDESELYDFFEIDPVFVGDPEAGDCLYTYQQNGFKITMLISTYEKCIDISIMYNGSIIYSQKHKDVLEIKKVDVNSLKVLLMSKETIIIKKESQIGVIVE